MVIALSDLRDPDNPENRIAGSPSDWVKHAVYAALREVLGTAGPLHIHECHAGRAVYRIDPYDPRAEVLGRLTGRVAAEQRAALRAVGLVEPAAEEAPGVTAQPGAMWYAGSALQNAVWLRPGDAMTAHEWDPATRRILVRCVVLYGVAVPRQDEAARHDGETALCEQMETLGPRDLLLLDPFDLWSHSRHAFRRERFRRLYAARRQRRCPSCLFVTWGRRAVSQRALATVRDCVGGADDGGAARSLLRLRFLADLGGELWLHQLGEHAEALREAVDARLDELVTCLEGTAREIACGLRWSWHVGTPDFAGSVERDTSWA